MALEFSRRIISNRLDQADTLVEIGTRDECECDQLYRISTLCDGLGTSELTRFIPSPMLASRGRCGDLLGLLCCDVEDDGWRSQLRRCCLEIPHHGRSECEVMLWRLRNVSGIIKSDCLN